MNLKKIKLNNFDSKKKTNIIELIKAVIRTVFLCLQYLLIMFKFIAEVVITNIYLNPIRTKKCQGICLAILFFPLS